MLRWFFTCVLLCSLTFGAVFLLTDPLHLWAGAPNTPNPNPTTPADDKLPVAKGNPSEPVQILVYNTGLTARLSPIVIPAGTVVASYKQDVPSERPGRLLLIARELTPAEKDKYAARIDQGDKALAKYFGRTLNYIAIDTNPAVTPPLPGQLRRWSPEESLEAGRVKIASEKRYFCELGVGDKVHEGDIVAIVNPDLALDELAIKQQKLTVAMADIETSKATRDEAFQRWDTMAKANQKHANTFPVEEERGGKLTYDRYVQEVISKQASYVQAQRELNASITQLNMHEIRARLSGIVRTVYKSRGDAVKELDQVMQVQDYDHLRVEALLEAEHANKVAVGDTVLVEPAIVESPRKVLNGHLQEVTCVAVTKGKEPMILSGSEDRTVRAWNPTNGEQKVKIEFNTPVRSLACTGSTSEVNRFLVGCSDGSARLFDLDQVLKHTDTDKYSPRDLPRLHTRSVTCVAFSPNGKICATGSEDTTICLWDTAEGKLIDQLKHAHKSPVTSIQFANDDTLVSAGRDNVLNVWVKKQAWVREGEGFDKRSGEVTHLGVSPDGKHVLFDDGKEMRILDLESKQIAGLIQNSAGAGFRGLAMFAPDGKTVLTTTATENRLQLWRTPEMRNKADDKKDNKPDDGMGGRAAELRQFVWSTGKEISAAYAPDASFIVTGTQDNQVLIWKMPKDEEINDKLTGTVSLVEQSVDASARQVRIWVEVKNQNGRLIPGGTATIVIPPTKK